MYIHTCKKEERSLSICLLSAAKKFTKAILFILNFNICISKYIN